MEEGQVGNVLPDWIRDGGEEKGYGYGEDGQAVDEFLGDVAFGGRRMSGHGCNGDGGEGKKDDGDDGRGFEDGVVNRVDGVVEEEVVLDAGSGRKDRGDLNVAAFVLGGENVEGGETEAEEGSGGDFGSYLGSSSRICARQQESNYSEQSQGIAAHDSGGVVGKPEQSDGDGDAGDGDMLAEDGEEKQGNPCGSEEFGVGSALVCGEESVGIDEVERCGEESGVGSDEFTGEAIESESSGGEGQPRVDDGRPCPRHKEAENGTNRPREWWIEDEAGLACVVGGAEGPVWVEIAVSELMGGFHPVEEVEVEVVAAGAAFQYEGKDSDEGGEREDEEVNPFIALRWG